MSVVRCQFRKTASGMYRAFQRKSSCLNELKRERTNVNTRRHLTCFNKSYGSSWHEAKRAENAAIRSKHCGSGESDIGHLTFTTFLCNETTSHSMLLECPSPHGSHPSRFLKNTPWVSENTHGVLKNSHGVFFKTRARIGRFFLNRLEGNEKNTIFAASNQ